MGNVDRVTYGWLGQPHRDRVKDFTTRREALAFAAKWVSGGKERTAKVRWAKA